MHGWMMLSSEGGQILAPNCLGRRPLLKKLLKNLCACSSSPLAIRRSHVTPILLFPLFCTRHSESRLAKGCDPRVVHVRDVGLGFGRRLHYWMTTTTSQLCVTAASHPIRALEVTEWPELE